MKASIALLASILISICSNCHANGALTVVANIDKELINLSRHEVRNLFMGIATRYKLSAISLPPKNHTRIIFNTRILGLTESRIQSYWAQMRFTGRKEAPKEIASEELMLEYLRNNKGAVGYLPAGVSLPDELTVIYKIF
ncbi:hypothetical protein KO519_13495 [Paraglaciecola agarilytica]|uniref:hypothetical protein n=1 Tax=Paraglaciecola chathamensis TaxID=368405 RepID=UPI001C07F511|nr:hypothetical protein [Paraglaciecola agarilytica]MBU3018698.1 hypothetical protein [Paraglaciecola agarilytica]